MSSRLDIESGANLSGMSKAGQALIDIALLCGWSARWQNTKRHVVTLRSPVTNKTINVPTTNLNQARATATLRQIRTHTEPARFGAVVERAYGQDRVVSTAFGDVHLDPTVLLQETREDGAPEYVEIPYGNRRNGDWWKRTFNDGTVVFVCKAHKDEHVVDNPRKIPGHNKVHTRGQAAEQPAPQPTETAIDDELYPEPEQDTEQHEEIALERETMEDFDDDRNRVTRPEAPEPEGTTVTVRTDQETRNSYVSDVKHRQVPAPNEEVLSVVSTMIATIVDQIVAERTSELERELAQVRERAESAEADLDALRELLGERSRRDERKVE